MQFNSKSAQSRHRRRHFYCAGVGVPVHKMTASPRRSFCVPAHPHPRNGHAVGDAEIVYDCWAVGTRASGHESVSAGMRALDDRPWAHECPQLEPTRLALSMDVDELSVPRVVALLFSVSSGFVLLACPVYFWKHRPKSLSRGRAERLPL